MKPAPTVTQGNIPDVAMGVVKSGLASPGSVNHGIVHYEGVKAGHSPPAAKNADATKIGDATRAAHEAALQMRPEGAKVGMTASSVKSGKLGLKSRTSSTSQLITLTDSKSDAAAPKPALQVPNNPEIAKFGQADKHWRWGKGWKEPFGGTPANMISGYRSKAPPFAKLGIQVPPAVKAGIVPGGVKKTRRRVTPQAAKHGSAPPPMSAKLGISGGGVKFGMDIVFAKGNGHVPPSSKHGRIPVADIVPLATKPGHSPVAVKRGVARGGALPRTVKQGLADGLLRPNWSKDGAVPKALKTGQLNHLPGVAAKSGSLHAEPWIVKNGQKIFTVKSGMIHSNANLRRSDRPQPVFTKPTGVKSGSPAFTKPTGVKSGSLRVLTEQQSLASDLTTTQLATVAAPVTATLGNPVSTSVVQGMVQSAVGAAVSSAAVGAVTPAAVASTTVATLPVTVAASATTTAAAIAAVTVSAVAAQSAANSVVPQSHPHGRTSSPATPLWAQGMGKNLPAPIALPTTPFPPAMIYVVNHRAEDLFFKQAGHVYNVIPAHSVARQSSFGGESWDIVDAIGQVFKQITIKTNNQRIEVQ
jgi:hypothetical protein